MYRIKVPAYVECNRNVKENIYDIANHSNSIILLYSYSIDNSLKSTIKCRGVKDFSSLDFSLIKERTILIHDLSRIKGVDELRSVIDNCERYNKYLILPLPVTYYKPYLYQRKGEDFTNKIENLHKLYVYIDSLCLEDISDKSVFREYRLNQLLLR